MTRDELFKLHEETTAKCLGIMRQKNQDYSGGTSDPFTNFLAGEVLGIQGELGILLRSLDKFQRIKAFVETGTLAVKSESVDDAIEDVINYMILLKGLIKHKQTPSPQNTRNSTESKRTQTEFNFMRREA